MPSEDMELFADSGRICSPPKIDMDDEERMRLSSSLVMTVRRRRSVTCCRSRKDNLWSSRGELMSVRTGELRREALKVGVPGGVSCGAM